MNFSGDTVDMVGLLFQLIPILLVALLLRWVQIIKTKKSSLYSKNSREKIRGDKKQ
ncbi:MULTISPECIES: hypothetical protein [unclassified Lysinibacillus]|jgi:hypothetical protein|uniref:hypothetical protein n=1 Tax=unclassified Lysinibacillus TaxID=2636778 RepID=UPI00382221ED